jgi:hypothetical protein
MARKGQFKKGGGRVGGMPSRISGGRGNDVIVVNAPASPRKTKRKSVSVKRKGGGKRKGKRRGGSTARGITLGKVVGSALVLASVAGTNNGPLGSKVYDLVQKVPGAKTFGGAATAGLIAGGLYKFTKFGGRFRPWMAAAGLVGAIAAGLKLGEQGTSFKWLGDGDDDVMHVE